MSKINDLIRKYDLKVNKIIKEGKVTFIDTDKGKYVIKKKIKDSKIFNYLNSRSFLYYPKSVTDDNDDYEMVEYKENYDIPIEYKMMDLIDIISLLHNKTTHYKEVDIDDFKEIYEDIYNNIVYLFGYYSDLATIIESKVYESPSEYLLIRNISSIYNSLSYCKDSLEKWYLMVKDNTKERLVVLHNNLELDHFIKSDTPCLISWDKAKIGLPIFDIYKLYKKHSSSFDFYDILKRYESNYPLKDDEKLLFFILIMMPDKIELNGREYKKCFEINKLIETINKSSTLRDNYLK